MGEWYVGRKTNQHRKSYGLYITPVAAADLMAKRVRINSSSVRILEPAAGSGVLACAIVEAVLKNNKKINSIDLVTYEIDSELNFLLKVVIRYLKSWCGEKYNVSIEVKIKNKDFALDNWKLLNRKRKNIFSKRLNGSFDVVVSNPPYFKLSIIDARSIFFREIFEGQINMYSIFMILGAFFLKEKGHFVYLIPRSFCSGRNFRSFRELFFKLIRPTDVHLFASRSSSFSSDNVLQENVVFIGECMGASYVGKDNAKISISSSEGINDIDQFETIEVPLVKCLDINSVERILYLPSKNTDKDILDLFKKFPHTTNSLGLKISTGPVVPFRVPQYIEDSGDLGKTHVPLIWMNHVRPMKLLWPLNNHKPEYININAKGRLLESKNYVFIRRFSAKEDVRRLTAAPYIQKEFKANLIGVENHVNYIYKKSGTITVDEAWGLSGLYNSSLFNSYFRSLNGNTQVSAAELGSIPLPSIDVISSLGRQLKGFSEPHLYIDAIVWKLLAELNITASSANQIEAFQNHASYAA